jgi:hypothetical protein
MPTESNKEILLKIQMNSMLEYLTKTLKYSYGDAFNTVVGSKTYHRLLNSTLYLNQGTLYVLDDFKKELESY